jgi:hypothetical protein
MTPRTSSIHPEKFSCRDFLQAGVALGLGLPLAESEVNAADCSALELKRVFHFETLI